MLSSGGRSILRFGCAAAALFAGVSGASAWERLGFASYGGTASYAGASVYTGGGYGLGGYPVVADAYHRRRIPRPTDLVPPAWGYGVYGVPSATVIQQAPAARPTITVIGRPTEGRRGTARTRILSRTSGGGWHEAGQDARQDAGNSDTVSGGARIVSVRVPRR